MSAGRPAGRFVLETERLLLREMGQSDLAALCAILQDDETMYAYEGALSDDEAQAWLDRQMERYARDGFGLWAVVLKETGELIGQCGLTLQDVDAQGTRGVQAAADAAPVYVAECSAWAGSDVQSAYALGIADSYAACLAAPQASATRAELAHMLSDLLQRV